MLVLVENAAKAIASSDVEAGHRLRVDDLRGQRVQRACVRDALVRAVGVRDMQRDRGTEPTTKEPHDHLHIKQKRMRGMRLDTPAAPARPVTDRHA
jgi:hypothetical protein